ncbi:helix-turn-helix transcriptional regulator [Ciceribacter sp. L1K23]|uniref:helix-turn-helix domain-containing protein n=1 Tax=Ciceribacter sp. L1K23 TaxID=2820276 RepID=UPI001B8331FB|nr:AraC family transcriptional regulator [Ciceribacter sp. L1K23]MBR0556481.1 helix-turn-helix transcriptional regulator [Ciceribacter sp. L1K23]
MIFVPLSFLVSLYLLVFLVRLAWQGRGNSGGNGLFLLLLSVHIVQSLLVGLRWGYGVTAILPLLSTLAGLVPPLSWLAFRDLAQERRGLTWRDAVHLLPMLLVLVLLFVWRSGVDIVIVATFVGYGGALLWLSRLGPDGLVASRLDGSLRSWRALQLTGAVLVGSALVDVLISLDMLVGGGRHSPAVVSVATTIVLLLLGIAAVAVGQAESEDDEEEAAGSATAAVVAPESTGPSDQDQKLAGELDRLMAERRLYADAGLNLSRLARRLGSPARAVSHAVNRVHGMSVSQYVNERRVADACRLLSATDMPVTRVAYEAGFMTKSNFNREFLRVTGMNPSDWRKVKASGQMTSV